MTLLEQMLEKRKAAQDSLDALLTKVGAEKRDMSTDEDTEFRSMVETIKGHDVRITELRDLEARSADAAQAAEKYAPKATVTSEPEVYRKGGTNSFWRDKYRAERKGDTEARERLIRNDRVVAVETEKRALNTTAGTGGEFAPPLWMVNEYIALARPGRPLADVLDRQPLPKGVSSINLPAIRTGSSTAVQGTENAAVSNTDPGTASVTAPVGTIAGFVVVAQQDLDQSPVNFDQVILNDLAADYARQLDATVIAALTGATGINAVTYTDTAPTSAKINSQVAQSIATVHANRYAPPTHVAMTPARWGHFVSYTDANGRPLVVPNPAYGAFNAFGNEDTPVVSQGVAGTLQGIPVLIDASIPQNLGTGTNQDEILVLKANDNTLFEGSPMAEALPQTYGQNMSVVCRFYNYYALAIRYPKSIAVIGGTGMVTTLAYGA